MLTKKTSTIKKDVVVVGGGTSGFIAAIAAARNGANVLLVEKENFLGGTHTGGMVNMIRAMRHMRVGKNKNEFSQIHAKYESSYDDEQLVFGIIQEYVDRAIDAKSAWGIKGQSAVRQLIDPEMAKWIIDRMVDESGVETMLFTQVIDVLVQENSVKGVAIEDLFKRIEVDADVTIDATGDGNICAAAGADFIKGRDNSGLCQPLTLYFTMADVNIDETIDYLKENSNIFGEDYVNQIVTLKQENKPFRVGQFDEKIKEAIKNGDYPLPFGLEKFEPDFKQQYSFRPMFNNGKTRYNIVAVNMDMAYSVDPTDQIEMSKAMMAMRDIAVKMALFYYKYIPGFQNSYLERTAQFVGVRDSRRIIGDYMLTQEDVLTGRAFDDGISRYGSIIDIHSTERAGNYVFKEVGGSGWFHIPYAIMLPKGLENIIAAGRFVSADDWAQGATRSQGSCMLTGQAAGTAAAIAAKEGVTPRGIDIKKLQKTLISQNVLI